MTVKSLAADRYEKGLALCSIALLVIVLIAVVRGIAHWGTVPVFVWLHLVTVLFALGLTPIMLLRPRGTRLHRRLGTIWMAAMFVTALDSLLVRQTNHGHFSFIHILSFIVIFAVPRALWTARKHQIDAHRQTIRGMVTGALLIAGLFTLPFGRMLGVWLMGL